MLPRKLYTVAISKSAPTITQVNNEIEKLQVANVQVNKKLQQLQDQIEAAHIEYRYVGALPDYWFGEQLLIIIQENNGSTKWTKADDL